MDEKVSEEGFQNVKKIRKARDTFVRGVMDANIT